MSLDPARTQTRARFAKQLGEDVYFLDQLQAAGLLVLAEDGRVLVEDTKQAMYAAQDRVAAIPRIRTATFAEFARLIGRTAPWVTQLRKDGRLVLTEDGKRVKVDASRALIRETEDPAKAGVAERHEADRQSRTGAPAPAPAPAAPSLPADDPEDDVDEWLPAEGGHKLRRAKALADKEEALAEKARRENLVEMGKLLPADQVESALFAAATTLRTTLESLPDTLAPELAAARDEGKVRVIVAEAIEHALEEISRAFNAIAKPEAA